MKGSDKNFFFAIGPPKTGTTWLYQCLRKHPDVYLTPVKELRYFWGKEFIKKDTLFKRRFSNHWYFKSQRKRFKKVARKAKKSETKDWYTWEKNFFFSKRSDEWYMGLFDFDKLPGDISPQYSQLSKESIEEMAKLLPRAKIIIGLRNPIERVWSSARMRVIKKAGPEKKDKIAEEKFLKEFNRSYNMIQGGYINLINRWTEAFSKDQVFYYFFEELENAPEELYHRICDFLEIERRSFIKLNKKVGQGVKAETSDDFKAKLTQQNLADLEQMADYFDSEYPKKWLSEAKEAISKLPKESLSKPEKNIIIPNSKNNEINYKVRPGFYRDLSQNEFWRLLNYASWVSEKHKFLYLETPKAACTKIKSLIYKLEGIQEPKDSLDLHSRKSKKKLYPKKLLDFSYEDQEKILFSENWFRFAFARNPYERLQSCYYSKIYVDEDEFFKKFKEEMRKEASSKNQIITFEEFVKTICAQKDMDRDTHWRSQNSVLFTDLIQYDTIGKVENFSNDMKNIFAKLEIMNSNHINLDKKENASTEDRESVHYSEELSALVYDEFNRDFEKFSYDKDSWKKNIE